MIETIVVKFDEHYAPEIKKMRFTYEDFGCLCWFKG